MKTAFTYVGIRVKDLRESIDFYTNLLGMTLVKRHVIAETGGEIAELQSGDAAFILELNHYGAASPYNADYVVGEGLDHLAFAVDDLDAALREAARRGTPARSRSPRRAVAGRTSRIPTGSGLNWSPGDADARIASLNERVEGHPRVIQKVNKASVGYRMHTSVLLRVKHGSFFRE